MSGKNAIAYSTRAFKAAKQFLRENYVQCWVSDSAGKCKRRGTIPDHQPPLSTVPDPAQWQGQFWAMCNYHSCRQRGQLRHGKHRPPPSRQW